MKTETIVTINSDPLTIGDAATEADLEQYRANLEAHLCERFERPVTVRTAQSLRTPYAEDTEIHHYVREQSAGDGWIALV